MTPITATGLALVTTGILGLIIWAIHAAYEHAEQRLRDAISTALERPDDGHLAALTRSRALDDEYRQLVADAQHDR